MDNDIIVNLVYVLLIIINDIPREKMRSRGIIKCIMIVALVICFLFFALYPAKTIHVTNETVRIRSSDLTVLSRDYTNVSWVDSWLNYYMGDNNLDGRTIIYQEYS